MNVLDEFKNYKRKFIQISQGHENLYFVECLRDKCNEMLKEHEDRVQKLKLNESNSN